MRAWVLAMVLWCAALGAMAQEGPRVTVEVPETNTIVGQPVIVRIKLLVPTWFPSPPDFPSLDLPGLMVRLPERASRPVSERVGSETWSGILRTYRIYPLQFGRFDIAGQSVRIAYANPGQTDPIVEEVGLPDITINAGLPAAARNLNPLILARSFELEANVEAADDIAVGDAVVRTLTARIGGTTPILIPQLMPDTPDGVFRSYRSEPAISESADGDVLSGTRVERTTYLARGEGAAELPAVRIDWYNLDTRQVETAEVAAVALSVDPAPDQPLTLQDLPFRIIVGALVALAASGIALRMLWPRLVRAASEARARWRASEPYAHRKVMAAIRARDLDSVYAALEQWQHFQGPLADTEVAAALAEVGAGEYADTAAPPGSHPWSTLKSAYLQVRKAALHDARRRSSGHELPPLNSAAHR